MMNFDNVIDVTISMIGGLVSWYFGAFDGLIRVLLAFVVIDYVSGLMKAYMKHEVSSEIGFKGIAKKGVIFMLVGLSHVVDELVPGDTGIIRDVVIFFYLSNEGISIIENAIEIGVPVPEGLKERLLKFKE